MNLHPSIPPHPPERGEGVWLLALSFSALPSRMRGIIALERAQWGLKHHNAKPLRGFSGVFEIVSDYARDTYRAVYVVNLGNKIYVLHCFQKKSTRGIKTPKKEIDLIKRRLKIAQELAKKKEG